MGGPLGAILSNANLISANLADADLTNSNLSMANLSNANLFRAKLAGANLFRANLSQADFSQADLFMALLVEATIDNDTNFRRARMNRSLVEQLGLDAEALELDVVEDEPEAAEDLQPKDEAGAS